ncbi:MAG: TOBE domain-containing protein [Rhodobacter sp.]|nr:TOBE domain-containing protein [Rhodobacter sp.]
MLDEPFSSLDAQLRMQVRDELHRVLRNAGVSAILVTHDQSKAFGFADRVLVRSEGAVVQEGNPEEFYRTPETPWIARFVGASNFIKVNDMIDLVPDPSRVAHLDPAAEILVRPEDVSISIAEDLGTNAVIEEAKFAGNHMDIAVHLKSSGTPLRLMAGRNTDWYPGQEVSL